MEPFEPLKIEKEIAEYWDGIKLFEKIKSANKNGKKFFYLDGPPYVNGNPHMGHARTRAIRDPLLKYRVMKGCDVNLQPGYDCHGLPIEIKVEEELGLKRKEDIEAFGPEKFIEKCRERAVHYTGVFNAFYKRFGLHWDFEHPYKTLDNDYISASWAFFKKCEEKGLLYKGKATTAWCPRCETALAGYEATDEYRDVTDNSIYVKFPIDPSTPAAKKLGAKKGDSILIWTTTPWTLPANLAVTVNQKYEYVFVKVKTHGGEERWLMAKELAEKVMADCEITQFKIDEIGAPGGKGKGVQGKELEGLKYEFVLADSVPENKGLEKEFRAAHTILLGDFVTLEDGTGCVHTAPGHGQDDYSVGVKYGLPPFSPVGPNGKYTEEGGALKGIYVKKADAIVIESLESRGLLPAAKKITHRYAHCWRCKTAIIYRASPQWFVSIGKIKDQLIKENKKVNWVPGWAGEKRFQNWIEEARDWCVSRQRYWGIPLPIWECAKSGCGGMEVIGSWDELKKKAVKLPAGEPDLHVPYVGKIKLKCKKCGEEMSRVPDITDIWFESGAATWASLGYPDDIREKRFEKLFPMDFITEGLDQTRGWFYTIMVEGVIMFGETPYHNVLMNEWVLDKNGDKMSKSLGNVVAPEDVMKQYGADITRFYLLEEAEVWEKLKFNAENMKITFRLFNTLWNCYQFLKTYAEAAGFDPISADISKYEKHLKPEDAWMLSRLVSLDHELTKQLESYHPYECAKALDDFVMNDLSRWYIKIIRDRAWVSAEGKDREAAILTLYMVVAELAKMMAPFAPFISEYIHRDLSEKKGGEHDGKGGAGANGEGSVFLAGWPKLKCKSDEKLEKQMALAKEIVEQVNAARDETGIKLRWPVKEVIVVTKEELKQIGGVICNMANSKAVRFVEEEPKGVAKPVRKEFSAGVVVLSGERTQDMVDEGLIRDLMRQVQMMRKKESLKVADEVKLKIYADKEFAAVIERFKEEIASNTTSSKVEVVAITGKPAKFNTEAKFEGRTVWLDCEK